MRQPTLAAFSAERRIAAVTIFRGTHLENTSLRHLPIDPSRAAGSVRELVTRTLEQYQPEFVAISVPSDKAGERIRTFCEVVKEVASNAGIPTIQVEDRTLMSAYGSPQLTRKEHVRGVARTIWPIVSESKSKRAAVDALACGLYVQVERLFSLYEEER